MPLGARAANPINTQAPLPIFCHTATLYWILQENAGGGLDPDATVIAAANLMPQAFFTDTAKSGTWNFAITPSTPPVGTVLFWPQHPTHTAIVTGANQISGYNQSVVFAGAGAGPAYATCAPAAINPGLSECKTIGEAQVLAAAAMLG